jgi:hypothetical protein
MAQNNLLPAPMIINTDEGLQHLLHDLHSQKRIAVDTESTVCMSIRKSLPYSIFHNCQDYLLDPLSGIDLTPLGKYLRLIR